MKQETHLRAFCEVVGKVTLFDYQIMFLNDCLTFNRVVGIFGRQMGKTTILGLFVSYEAIQNDNYIILIIAPTERQATNFFLRLKEVVENSGLTKDFIANSTMSEIRFKNGSVIKSVTTGDNGQGIRGLTADLIILEESSYIKSSIISTVIMPMLASRGDKGKLIQIGTPFNKNHFYEASLSDKYKVHQYDYTHNPLFTEDFIAEQKESMSSMEFAMEYEAKFIDDTDSYFSRDTIMNCVKDYELGLAPHPKNEYVCGFDVARMGQDRSVFTIVEKDWITGNLKVHELIETKHKLTTDAIGRIQLLDEKYNFKKVYIDCTGLGAGVADVLRERLGGKIEPLTFTLQSKQDIFSNLKMQMEKGILSIPNHKRMLFEMLNLKYEISSSGNLKIHHPDGEHDDFPDSLALAVYHYKPKPKSSGFMIC
jgi:phage terminase large subunit-like protein